MDRNKCEEERFGRMYAVRNRFWENFKKGTLNPTGFTLLEVLLVLSILGFLVHGVIPYLNSSPDRVRQTMNSANIKKIEGAAQVYRLDVGSFPVSVRDLVESPAGVSGWRGPYLQEWPRDPFNPVREYEIDSLGQVK